MIVNWAGIIYGSDSNPIKIYRFLTKEDAIAVLAKSYRDYELDVRVSDLGDMAEIFVDELLTVHIMKTPADDASLLRNGPLTDFA